MNEQKTYRDISSYGVVGNLETCALISREGSVDWLCLPYLESPSVFGAILDPDRGGSFLIAPEGKYEAVHAYASNTNILTTRFVTASGAVRLTDFMPVKNRTSGESCRMLVRKVEGTAGAARLRVIFRPRFDYGRKVPLVFCVRGGVVAECGGERLALRPPEGFSWRVRDGAAEGMLAVRKGEEHWFVLSYGEAAAADPGTCARLLAETKDYWEHWVSNYLHLRGVFDEPWHDAVIRSGLALKLLINPDSGAIAAAATASLPEEFGGARNWDYRFAWLRDSSFTIQALYHLGDVNELRGYNRWITEIVRRAREVSKLQALYALRGEQEIREDVLKEMRGYRDSRPVRVGNAAVEQRQLDIYGELVNGIYETSRYGAEISTDIWDIAREMVNYVCDAWREPDSGIWEFRGRPRHFVYSKLMCWVALDRAIRIARAKHYSAPLALWVKTQEDIRNAILHNGYDGDRNSFVQSFGSRELDAAALLIPAMGFLPFSDPRVQGTIRAIRRELVVRESLVYRYRNDDGLPGHEGCFTLCSFWLARALALSGRWREASEIFENTLRFAGPLGLLAEEIDPATGRQLGNFPQAFSHIGLINASLYIGMAKGRKRAGTPPGLAEPEPALAGHQ